MTSVLPSADAEQGQAARLTVADRCRPFALQARMALTAMPASSSRVANRSALASSFSGHRNPLPPYWLLVMGPGSRRMHSTRAFTPP